MFENLTSKFTTKSTGLDHDKSKKTSKYSEDGESNSHDSTMQFANIYEEDKKKKKAMIIRVIIVLAIAYLGVTEFLLKEDSTPMPVAPPVAQKKRNKPNKAGTVVKTDTPTSTPMPEANAAKKDEVPKMDDIAKSEAPKIETKEEVKVEPKLETVLEVKPIASEPIPPIENINIAEKLKEEDTPVIALETKKTESQVSKNIDSLIDSIDKEESDKIEKSEKPEKTQTKATKLEDKIVEDDVYVAAPN